MTDLYNTAYRRVRTEERRKTLTDWARTAVEAFTLAVATLFVVVGAFSLLWWLVGPKP